MVDRIGSDLPAAGYSVVASLLPAETLRRLANDRRTDEGRHGSTTGRAGRRDLLRRSRSVREIAGSQPVRRIVEAILGPGAFAVKALWFDKRTDANWNVGWHQDLMIAVKRRCDVVGYLSWSAKCGVPHVMPPADVLARILTIRVNVDASRDDNGPLRVLPGSHRQGILGSDEVKRCVQLIKPEYCLTAVGGAVMMSPLLLHSSIKSQSSSSRRVLHLEFANFELSSPLQWHDRVGPVSTVSP